MSWPGWYPNAGCRGADNNLFFPVTAVERRAGQALCRTCPVQLQCLEYAVTRDITTGTWGGISDDDRPNFTLFMARHRLTVERAYPLWLARSARQA